MPSHFHWVASGHIWQGRFKAFPIEADERLLTVLGNVERNRPTGEFGRAWTRLALVKPQQRRGHKWFEFVNEPQTEVEVFRLRESVPRSRPYGGELNVPFCCSGKRNELPRVSSRRRNRYDTLTPFRRSATAGFFPITARSPE